MLIFHVEKPKESAYKVEGVELASSSPRQLRVKRWFSLILKKFLAMGDLLMEKKFLKNVVLVILLLKVEKI